MSPRSIVIVGGGASGVLLAAHLLRGGTANVRVTLIEKRRTLGRGIAYSALQQNHVLNVPASNMGAFADDPEHFWRWAVARGLASEPERFVFLPRARYGAYLADVLAEASIGNQLTLIGDGAIDVRQTESGVEIMLAGGGRIVGDVAVLAVGHEEFPARGKGIAVRIGSDEDTPLDPDAPVMILGSGLSMVDAWLTLAETNHAGPITIISRHGLLPLPHQSVPSTNIEASEVPFGVDVRQFTQWLRRVVDAEVARSGDWRSVVDGLRPFNQRIWQSWSRRSRERFLEHARPFWNVHRHRLPPALHRQLVEAVSQGQVSLWAGKLVDLERSASGVTATVRDRGASVTRRIEVTRVYDCGGVTADVTQSSNPLIRTLVARGAARPDPLRIGLDVTSACEVVDRDGTASQRLLAVGPLTRGLFWEIEAIPDIRVQVAIVAAALATRH